MKKTHFNVPLKLGGKRYWMCKHSDDDDDYGRYFRRR